MAREGRAGCLGSGQPPPEGANAVSPLPARAGGQVEVSVRASPSLQPHIHPSIPPGTAAPGTRLCRAAPLPLLPRALPGHRREGKLLSNPT